MGNGDILLVVILGIVIVGGIGTLGALVSLVRFAPPKHH